MWEGDSQVENEWTSMFGSLCSTNTPIIEPCCILNMSDMCVGHTYMVWFLRICHIFACHVSVRGGVAVFVLHNW